jgi:hypothetical protein
LLGAWEVENKIRLDKRLRRAMQERHVLVFETGEIAASTASTPKSININRNVNRLICSRTRQLSIVNKQGEEGSI